MEEANSFIIQNITKNITKYVIISLFIIYIAIEIISITKFSFDYNYNYNYGKKLKDVCKNRNLEFETNRYQLYSNIVKNIIQNTTNTSYNYVIILSIILIFAIIFGLLITYILYNFINDIIISDKNNTDKFKYICYLMMIMICGFSLIITPLYIGYNFDINNEFKLDIFNNYVKYAENIIGILIIVMIIININTYNLVFASNYKYGNSFIIIMSLLFYLCLYLTKSIISFYKKKISIINYKNENIKSNSDFINDFLKNELDTNSNIFNEYLSKLFNIDYNNTDLNFYTSIFIISLILIAILMIFNRSKTLKEYIKENIDYKKLIDFHIKKRADLTICSKYKDFTLPFGEIETDKYLNIKRIKEKPLKSYFVNLGIYVFKTTFLKKLKSYDFKMMNEVIDYMLKKNHKVITFPVYEEWQDIGNKEDYFKLKKKIKK